jgi:hypothetical protein
MFLQNKLNEEINRTELFPTVFPAFGDTLILCVALPKVAKVSEATFCGAKLPTALLTNFASGNTG